MALARSLASPGFVGCWKSDNNQEAFGAAALAGPSHQGERDRAPNGADPPAPPTLSAWPGRNSEASSLQL